MCVIIHLPPNRSIETDKLWNAVCNNWHGWGLGLWNPEDKKLSIHRSIPENSWLDENDPDAGGNFNEMGDIVKMLDENKNLHRFLHLRHATRGRINFDNCHPVSLYNKDGREVYLMHNGSFHYGLGDSAPVTSKYAQQGYGPPIGTNTVQGTGMSDTVDFCKNLLIPPLTKFVNGDYQDPDFIQHVWSRLWDKYGSNSRVLIFSNDLEPLKAGIWDKFQDSEGQVDYWSSNNLYFDRVSRGPIFQQGKREEAKRDAERKAAAAGVSAQERKETEEKAKEVGNGILMIEYKPSMFQQDPIIIKGLQNLLEMYGDGVDASVISTLRMCSVPEFEAMIMMAVKECKVNALAYLFDHIIREFGEQHDIIEPITKKKEDAEKVIASLKKQLQHYQKSEANGGQRHEIKMA